MSLVEEPSEESDQKEPEIRLQEDELTKESDPEDQKDANMRMKDVKTSQRDKRTINALSLFKEDFSQFKEEVFKMFRDKDVKTEPEDNKPASTTLDLLKEDFSQFQEEVFKMFRDKDVKTEPEDNKPTSTTLDLLKDDHSQFKEDATSVFSINSSKDKDTKSAGPKSSQSGEKTINRLSFFKDDLSNFFRIGLSKEKDNKGVTEKEDLSDTFEIKVSKAERTTEPFKSLFRGDQKTSPKTENSQGGKKTFSEQSGEQTDDGFKGNVSKQNDERVATKKINNNMKHRTNNLTEDGELELTVSEGKTETQQSQEMIPASQTVELRCKSEEWHDERSVVSAEDERINEEVREKEEEEEEKPPETLPLESLCSGISLFTLRDPNKDDMRHQPGGDVWSVKNFAYYLTFDPNTANSELRLTDCNREATRVWSELRPPGHPDRFEHCPQVLCREGLLDTAYWEVVWSGGADIGVTYNNISRDGDTASCLLGHNKQSWSLECSEGSYTPCHDNKRFRSSSPEPFTRRVGVYLDWSAGSLSFYCVSHETMVHLHTFTSTFTEPLYPGFWVWAYDGSVSLRQVELDWERLLQ